MPSFARELLTVDRQRLDLRAGVLGLVVLAVFGAAVGLVGPEAIAAAIGALVVLATDPPPAGRSWATMLLPLIVGGAFLTFVAVSIGDDTVPAALLVGAVGVVAALHAGRSEKASLRGLVATLWIILALTLHDTDVSALTYAVAFAIGGTVGVVLALLRARAGTGEVAGTDDVFPEAAAAGSPRFGALLRSPLGQLAVLRGVGLAVAVALGSWWFPAHPAWIAITSVVVMRPPTSQAIVVGLQRSLGTGVGVLVAVVLSEAVGDSRTGLVILFLVAAFLMMAVRDVNYALFAMLVTAVVVYGQRILGGDAAESGRARLLETLLGVAIAFAVLGIAKALARTTTAAA